MYDTFAVTKIWYHRDIQAPFVWSRMW